MKSENKKGKAILLAGNILLIMAMLTAALLYSRYISKPQSEIKKMILSEPSNP